MAETEAQRLGETADALDGIRDDLLEFLEGRETSWTISDLRRELGRWEQELCGTTGAQGQRYSPDTIKTHIGHGAQFIRWLAGEWQPLGPRNP